MSPKAICQNCKEELFAPDMKALKTEEGRHVSQNRCLVKAKFSGEYNIIHPCKSFRVFEEEPSGYHFVGVDCFTYGVYMERL